MRKRGQIGVEYLLILGFLTFITISTLAIAMFYSSTIKDEIKISQLDNLCKKIVSSAENVFYSGEPSKITIYGYFPEAITSIQIINKEIGVNIQTETGENTLSYISKVNLTGNLSTSSGLKKLKISAQQNSVLIEEE